MQNTIKDSSTTHCLDLEQQTAHGKIYKYERMELS